MKTATRNWREDVKALRERLGGLTEATKTRTKEQNKTEKALKDALKGGPKTIPQLAQALAMPSDRVLWYVMAMKRYGKVAETGLSGDYYLYALKETQA